MSKIILKAIRKAEELHAGQTRKVSGEDYVGHPVLVSYLVTKYKGHSSKLETLIASALLHDTVEDCGINPWDLAPDFGMDVASIVHELTITQKELDHYGNKLNCLLAHIRGMSSYALVVKLCNRLANLMDNPSQKMVDDTRTILDFLKKNRLLTRTQSRIIMDIQSELEKHK